jgi:hypothetical protein
VYNLAQDQLSCQRRPRLHRWQRGRPFTLVRVCLRQIDILEVSDDSGSAKILRTFRLLRPLRALRAAGRFKNIRMLVELLIACLPMLSSVFGSAPRYTCVLNGHAASLAPYESDTPRPWPRTNRTRFAPR